MAIGAGGGARRSGLAAAPLLEAKTSDGMLLAGISSCVIGERRCGMPSSRRGGEGGDARECASSNGFLELDSTLKVRARPSSPPRTTPLPVSVHCHWALCMNMAITTTAATNGVTDLSRSLHFHPAATAGSAARRGVAPVWLEAGAVHAGDGTICLTFCALHRVRGRQIMLDTQSCLVYAPPEDGAQPCPQLESALAEVNAAALAELGGTPPGVVTTIARLIKRLQAPALFAALWPPPSLTPPIVPPPSDAPFSRAAVVRSVLALANHPLVVASAPLAVDEAPRVTDVLAGLSLHVGLFLTAAYTLRRQVVCSPLPAWMLAETGGGSGGGGGGSSSSAGHTHQSASTSVIGSMRQINERAVEAALGGMPRLALPPSTATGGGSVTSSLEALFSRTPEASLYLLYYQLVLAPSHLVRERRGVLPTAVAAAAVEAPAGATTAPLGVSFLVIHGPWPESWVSTLTPPQRSEVTVASLLHAATAAVDDLPPPGPAAPPCLPLWDAAAEAKHGTYGTASGAPTPLFHGTPPENAYSILSNGLRSLSGTRHESSGAVFGDGVYFSADRFVCRQFARVAGTTWGLMGDLFSVGATSTAAAPSSTPAPRSSAGGGGGCTAPTQPVTFSTLFECEVIAAPTNTIAPALAHGSPPVRMTNGYTSLPPFGYVVVGDPSLVRITRLHLERTPWVAGGRAGAAAPPTRASAADGGGGGVGAGVAMNDGGVRGGEAAALRPHGWHAFLAGGDGEARRQLAAQLRNGLLGQVLRIILVAVAAWVVARQTRF